jgi:16S rRNA (guanine527-N7)-methyltransferase
VGGSLLSYKGPGYKEEIDASAKALSKLGGEIADVRKSELEDGELDHYIVVVRKVSPTPKTYPRKAGTPSKQPL